MWIARKLCRSHYRRFARYGDPLAGPPIRNKAPEGLTMEDVVKANTPTGLPSGQCWEWLGNVNTTGYGRATFGGQILLAHRVAWEAANGRAIPDGLLIRHRCDNRPCVNPSHLELGTQGDNLRDMRWGRSVRAFNRKLTEQDIPVIRARHEAGDTYQTIARDYHVSVSAILCACTRRTWKHVP